MASTASSMSDRAGTFLGSSPRTAAAPKTANAIERGYWERCAAARSKNTRAGPATANCEQAAAVPNPQRLRPQQSSVEPSLVHEPSAERRFRHSPRGPIASATHLSHTLGE